MSNDSVQFSSVAQSCPTLCDPWIAACQAYANKADRGPPARIWNDRGCISVPALVERALLLATTITTILLYDFLSSPLASPPFPLIKYSEWKNVAWHVSKQRMLQPSSHHITATQTVSPEGTQDRNRMFTTEPSPLSGRSNEEAPSDCNCVC